MEHRKAGYAFLLESGSLKRQYSRLSDWFYYFGFLPVAAALPLRFGHALAGRHGRRVFHAQKERRQEMARSLRMAFPGLPAAEIGRITIEALRIQASEEIEVYQFPFWRPSNLGRIWEFQGLENLDQACSQGRGVLIITGHIGAFCSGLVALGIQGYRLSFLTRNSPKDSLFSPAFRRYARLKILWMERFGGGEHILFPFGDFHASGIAFRSLHRRLKDNGLVVVAIDVPFANFAQTEKVRFMGNPCRFPSGFLRLAYRNQTPIVSFTTFRRDDDPTRQVVRIGEALELSGEPRHDLQSCVDRLDGVIREHPSQWFGWDSYRHFLDELEPPPLA